MAVSEQTPLKEYVANGVTRVFPLGFDCENKDHLIVTIDGEEVSSSTWSLANKEVTFLTAPLLNKNITFQRNTPYSRDRNYQTYDNSFRPEPVNKDFDWIWFKLQELGVADWILGNRITALKNYVDDQDAKLQLNINNLNSYVDEQDNELRSYLMDEIRKQGVALDQLDDYYNYLMQRLAQIAVDRGWSADFVVTADGSNQQQVNDRVGNTWREKTLGYNQNDRVMLDNGDIVKSTVPNNTKNPNTDMTGWVKDSDASQILDGLENQHDINTKILRKVKLKSDLTSLVGSFNGDAVYVLENKKRYIYDSSLSLQDNGVTVIGKWEMGRQESYYASWFATPDVQIDQSAKLQAAWDYATSKSSEFIFDEIFYVAQKSRVYSDGLNRKVGLQVPDNSCTHFTKNAAIKLIPNSEPLGYVINFYLAENFKLYNPVVYGDVDDHIGADESNHCLNIVNCKNGYIHKPRAYNAWGDGLYVGTEYSSATLKQLENITIFEPYAEHCGRDCISITSGKNLYI